MSEAPVQRWLQYVLRSTFVHSDLNCFNLIYNRENPRYIGIIDFDFIRSDYQLGAFAGLSLEEAFKAGLFIRRMRQDHWLRNLVKPRQRRS